MEHFSGNRVRARTSKSVAEGETANAAEATIAFDDGALIERCRGGDMQAFASLVAKYQDRLYNLVYRMCGRHADAEEIAQEAFLKAFEKLSTFRGQSGFYTWLFRIAANLVISQRRRGGRIKFQSFTDPQEFSETQADNLTAPIAQRREPSPPAAALAAETQDRIARALLTLEDDFRVVLVLRDIEDMEYDQIADVLALPLGTVKSRIHRARCLLRDQLADLVS